MKTKFQLDLAQTRPNQKNQRKKVKRVKKAKKLARADFDLDPIWQNPKSNDEEEFKKKIISLKSAARKLDDGKCSSVSHKLWLIINDSYSMSAIVADYTLNWSDVYQKVFFKDCETSLV